MTKLLTATALAATLLSSAAFAGDVPMPRPRPKALNAFAMEPPTMDPRSGNRGRKFGLPGKDSDYRKYQSPQEN